MGVSLADFNDNGMEDIVFGTNDDNIYLMLDDGTVADGFPFQTGDKVQSSPAILDLDGELVIFAGSNDDFLYAINFIANYQYLNLLSIFFSSLRNCFFPLPSKVFGFNNISAGKSS